jgi:hypothetical protein
VLGNWQARFWRPVERGDPSAEFNQPQGDHLTGPEVGFGVFGDGAQLLIDLVEQRRDKLHGDHATLLSWERCHVHSMEEAYDDCKPKKSILLVCKGLYASYGLSETNTIG